MTEIRVRFFGITREIVGSAEILVHPGRPLSAGELLDDLIVRHPRLEEWREYLRVAVNEEYTPGETVVSPGDDVAIIPPVSGG